MAEIKSESVADFIPESVADLLRNQHFADSDFEEAVRLGTNTPSRIKLRIEKVRDMLLSVA
jgi:hypothetical protein